MLKRALTTVLSLFPLILASLGCGGKDRENEAFNKARDSITVAAERFADSVSAVARTNQIAELVSHAESDTDTFLGIVTWSFGIKVVDLIGTECVSKEPGYSDVEFSLGAAVNSEGAFCLRIYLRSGLIFIPKSFLIKTEEGQINSWEIPTLAESNTFRAGADGTTIGFAQFDLPQSQDIWQTIDLARGQKLKCRLAGKSKYFDFVLCDQSIDFVIRAGRLHQLLYN